VVTNPHPAGYAGHLLPQSPGLREKAGVRAHEGGEDALELADDFDLREDFRRTFSLRCMVAFWD